MSAVMKLGPPMMLQCDDGVVGMIKWGANDGFRHVTTAVCVSNAVRFDCRARGGGGGVGC
eukprot:scaffold472_cov215-Alexandrium_tamarense.AAC.5